MTLRWLLWVIVFLATIFISQLQHRFFSPVLLLFLMSFGLVSFFYDRFTHKLKAYVSARDELVQRTDDASWELVIRNDDRVRTHVIYFWQEKTKQILPIEPNREAVIELMIDTRHCGVQQFPEVKLQFISVFGLFKLPLPFALHRHASVYVLPTVSQSLEEPGSLGDLIKLGQHQASGREANLDEVNHLRSLQPGDPRRLIHWKLSARLQTWMVRQFSKAQEKTLNILFELPRLNPQALESSLSLRDALLDHLSDQILSFLHHDFQVTLITPGSEGFVQTVRGLDRFDLLRKQLALGAGEEAVSLTNQLSRSVSEREAMVYYLVATEIYPALVTNLRELRTEQLSIWFDLIRTRPLTNEEKALVRELRSEGVEVRERFLEGGAYEN